MNSPGLDDNLFSLGGHSLTAVHLVTLIKQRLSVKLPVMTVFTHPTIRELARSSTATARPRPRRSAPLELRSPARPRRREVPITGN